MLPISLSRRTLLGGAASITAGLLSGEVFAQQTRTPVTLANASGAMSTTMQSVMKQQGFLEEFGLEPNVMHVADGSKIMGAVLGGEVDACMISGFGQIFPAIEKGGKLKIIAGAGLLPALGLFSGKPDVRTLKDLEGRTVGIGSVGALLHQLVVALCRKHGVDVSKVRFVNVGSSVDVFRAVNAGTVDAGPGEVTLADQPDLYKARLIEKGNMSLELTEFTYQAAWTSDQMIQKKRDILVRTLAAYAKLYRFVHQPSSKDAFLKARKAVFPNATDDQANGHWNYIQKYKPFAVDLVLSDERLRYMQQLNIAVNVQGKILPFEQVADMSIAQDALKLLK